MILATVRDTIADYVAALVLVYWIVLIAYIVLGWVEMFGARIPYHRVTSAIIGFIREASEPYLGIFRRFIPPIGPLDLSALVAILVLYIGGNLVADIIRG